MIFHDKLVNRDLLIKAIYDFNVEYSNETRNYDANWLRKSNYKYAILFKNQLFPCKRILSNATGVPVKKFSGGRETNTMLENLGFTIIKKPTDTPQHLEKK